MIEKLHIRRAQYSDAEAVSGLLTELDLMRPDLSIKEFRVASLEGRIVGIAHVEDVDNAVFISSVGVANELQGRGIEYEMMNTLMAEERRDVYVYTIIPSFFARLGFIEVNAPAYLPERDLFGCDLCEPHKCVCMMRHSDVS